MRKALYSLIIAIAFIPAKADEGMWLPHLLGNQYDVMAKKGLKLSLEQLYNVNQNSLKDAIVMIDGGDCTGEMVSEKGLMFTNHHCGYGEIQAHSSLEHDYLADGFWAMRMEDELPNPGKSASFLIRIEDVTSKIVPFLNENMSETERSDKIEELSSAIVSDATRDTWYNASIESMFKKNAFYLFVYETFRDVRLVGAPPSSIGDFGGDTDNWMWPRHTGDFSIFRIYMDPNGKPADFSPENIPYKPKHFLPVSLNGVHKGDFSMIWGYPGSTERYLTSYGVKYNIELYNPTITKIGTTILEKMKEKMDANKVVQIQYASKYASFANFWKSYSGQNRNLIRLQVIERKKNAEQAFAQWVNQSEELKKKYGNALIWIEEAYKEMEQSQVEVASLYFSMIYNKYTGEIISFSGEMTNLADILKNKGDASANMEHLKNIAGKHFKDYNMELDKLAFRTYLRSYYKDVQQKYHPKIFETIQKKYHGDFDKYCDDLYSKSVFATEERFAEFIKNPSAAKIEKDPAYIFYQSLLQSYPAIDNAGLQSSYKLEKGRRLYLAGLLEMISTPIYPDANSTMRCTYGTTEDYYPADGVYFSWQTKIEGVFQKEDPSNDEFIVPSKLKEIYQNKDYGRYGDGESMPLCFITNHDITGGNSGSPVINGEGQLIGLAFDSNWEGVAGDISFSPEMQRTVCVDIRYVLLIIDKFAGAQNLIDELTIIKN